MLDVSEWMNLDFPGDGGIKEKGLRKDVVSFFFFQWEEELRG